ncbi:hypothetical protein ACKU3I_022365 [Serratia marcescens]
MHGLIVQRISYRKKQRSDLKKKFSQKGQIYQTEGRLELIAYDISDHFQSFKSQNLRVNWRVTQPQRSIQKLVDKIGTSHLVVAMSSPDTREASDTVDGESRDLVQNWWKNVGRYGRKRAYTKQIIEAFWS